VEIFVTGITGFAGGYLAEALLAAGASQLVGLSRRPCWPPHWQHLSSHVPLETADLCDGPALEALLRKHRPQRIYHLAGYAHAGRSLHEPDAAWSGNLTATRTLYDAIQRWGGRPRILYVGSGLVYGESGMRGEGYGPPGPSPLAPHPSPRTPAYDEQCPLRPATPYATSKAAADLLSYQYTQFPGLDIVRVRPFNHIGPRQSPQYAVAHFAQQIAAIERGAQAPLLETGNLRPLRDLTDVRDMAHAYILLMERGQTGEVYNAANGTVHSMQDVLDRMLACARVQIEVRQKEQLMRASETLAVRGDAAKLRRELGWSPRYNLDQTLADTLDYWRHQ
jgi:GDP-4-dehydro-6-deoxy-D-mannose reductase